MNQMAGDQEGRKNRGEVPEENTYMIEEQENIEYFIYAVCKQFFVLVKSISS